MRFSGSIGQDAQLRSGGPWMALRDDPENRAGRRGVLRSKTQKQGALSFGYFSFGQAKEMKGLTKFNLPKG